MGLCRAGGRGWAAVDRELISLIPTAEGEAEAEAEAAEAEAEVGLGVGAAVALGAGVGVVGVGVGERVGEERAVAGRA